MEQQKQKTLSSSPPLTACPQQCLKLFFNPESKPAARDISSNVGLHSDFSEKLKCYSKNQHISLKIQDIWTLEIQKIQQAEGRTYWTLTPNSDGHSSPETHGPHLDSLTHFGYLHRQEFETAYSKSFAVAINTLSVDNTIPEDLGAQ